MRELTQKSSDPLLPLSPAQMDAKFKRELAGWMRFAMGTWTEGIENKIKKSLADNAVELLVWGALDQIKKPISSCLDAHGGVKQESIADFQNAVGMLTDFYEKVTLFMRTLETEDLLPELVERLRDPMQDRALYIKDLPALLGEGENLDNQE